MRTENYTIKAREAILDAFRMAGDRRNPEVTTGHMLLVLIRQQESLVPALLKLLEVDSHTLTTKARSLVERAPQLASDNQAAAPQELAQARQVCPKEAPTQGDE